MQRIINQAEFVVEDMLQGFIRAHSDYLEPTQNPRVLKIKEKQDKVGIVSGGGSGHKPAFIGYIGKNLLAAYLYGYIRGTEDEDGDHVDVFLAPNEQSDKIER